MPPMLEARDLRKSFGTLRAVDGVGFRVGRGETVGLLGPNGAGKTTTVSMICGLTPPDSGDVLIEGRPLRADDDPLKRRLGLVPQDLALYETLSARQNLECFASLYGLRGEARRGAIDRALEVVGLRDRDRDRVSTFSGGMKRRLNLAAALLHDPDLILLDEPTVGVDPQSRNAIFENLAELKRRGKSLLYTTHYMEEAERLCDRVVIVDHGRVIADDTPRGLARLVALAARLTIELGPGSPEGGIEGLLERVRGLETVTHADAATDESHTLLRVELSDLSGGARAVLDVLDRAGAAVLQLHSDRPDLETVFLNLTGRSLRD